MTKLNKNYIIALLTAMLFLGMSGIDIYIASMPKIISEFQIKPNTANYTITFYSLGVAVLVLIAAILSDRYGRKAILIIGLALFSLSAFVISLSDSILVIVMFRFIQSSGCAFAIIISRQILKDIMDEREQMKANAIILSGLVISPALAPVLGAYLAHNFGWRSCFVFSGIFAAILIIITSKLLPETNLQPIKKIPHLSKIFKNYCLMFTNKLLLGLMILYASAVAVFFTFIGISSYLYIGQLGISPIMYSYLYILIAAAYLLGNQYLMMLNRRYVPYRRIIGGGINIAMIGLLTTITAVFFKTNTIIAVILSVGVLFTRAANAIINPASQVLLINHFGEEGSRALGLTICCSFAFQGVAISLVTLFYQAPLTGLIIITTAFSLVALITFLLIKHKIAIEP